MADQKRQGNQSERQGQNNPGTERTSDPNRQGQERSGQERSGQSGTSREQNNPERGSQRTGTETGQTRNRPEGDVEGVGNR